MLVRELPVKDGDRYLIPGDLHFGNNDAQATDIMTRVAAIRDVNGVILIGDTFESAGISRHGRPARKFRFGAGTIKAEEAAARPHFADWRALVTKPKAKSPPKGRLHVLTGNHEHWWQGVQDEYPGLVDTPWFELYGDLFDHWHVHAEHTALKLGPLLVCHGHRLRGSLAKNTAASVLANYPGQNTLYGHTHRVDVCTRPTYKYGAPVSHGAWTIGHLRSVSDSLTDSFLGPHSESHQQGFAIVSFHEIEAGLWFSVEQGTIHRAGKEAFALLSGEVYY